MIGTSASRLPGDADRSAWLIGAFVLLGSAVTAGAVIAGNGNIVVALAPVLLAVALGAIWFAPIRIPLLVVIFLSLALDATDEGPWNSPLAPIGRLLALNLNKSLPIAALAVPGIVLIFGFLLVLLLHRRLRGIRTDRLGWPGVPKVAVHSIVAAFVAVLAFCVVGWRYGGDMQMAKIQLQSYVLVLVVAYLCAMSLRGLRDYRILGMLVVAAAAIKSVYALWVEHTVLALVTETNGRFATTHGDSMLFAAGAVLLIVQFAERPGRRTGLLALVLLPLLLAGMVANSRRLVWVEVAGPLLMFWVISRRSPLKRLAAHGMLAAVPVILLYGAVGWNSQSRMFAPVKLVRSLGDSEVDASTLYRDLEDYDLLATIRVNPVMGTGFGHMFAEPVTLPSIEAVFKEFRYMPHNSVLGLWAFCGALGYTGLFIPVVVGVYFAARSYAFARLPDERVAAFMALAAVVIYLIQCWGDIGFSERKSIFLLGPALAIAAQLAMTTGAWRTVSPARQMARVA